MSIQDTIARNTANNPNRELNAYNSYVPIATPPAYSRPSDWLTLPTVGPTDQKFVGLIAVTNDSANFVAFSATTSTGTYTVDWGDGTSPQTFASGAIAQYSYNYSSLPSGTLTTRGYRQAIVTITPTTGNLLSVNLNKLYVNTPALVNGRVYKWLDISVGSPNLTSLFIGWDGTTQFMYASWLEQCSVISASNSLSMAYMFYNCFKLQSIPTFNVGTGPSNFTSTFQNCYSLTSAPYFTTTVTPNALSSTFRNCFALVYVPDYTFTVGGGSLSLASTFNSCNSLRRAPMLTLDTTNVQLASTFVNCISLQYVPTWNTRGVTVMSSTFSGCSSLQTAPNFNTQSVTDASSMFASCSTLKQVPNYNLSSVTTVNNMFDSCYGLTYINSLYMPVVISTNNMFLNCYNLKRIASITTGTALTNTTGMFNNCRSLESIPLFNTINVTNTSIMFQNCQQITTIPTFNLANNANTYNMFTTCVNLTTIPDISTANVTNASFMFSSCYNMNGGATLNATKMLDMSSMFANNYSMTTAPTFSPNTSNATNMSSMFLSCNSLLTIPTYDTIKVTNISGFAQTANSLQSLPGLNLANVTNPATIATGTSFSGFSSNVSFLNATGFGAPFGPAFNRTDTISNVKSAISFLNCNLDKTNLENFFANGIVNIAAVQAITITGNPGADTANSKTTGTTGGSNVLPMANTVGIVAGASYIYGTGVNTGIPVTFGAASVITWTGSGTNPLQNNDSVMFTAIVTTTGITTNTQYFVVNRTSTNFKISTALGGLATTFTTGTGTMSIGGATISNKVLTVNANANVIINGVAGITNASLVVTTRQLNQNYATTKNWTITG